MKPVTLLILNGEPPSPELLDTFWNKASHRICADGGANFLYKLDLQPDVIIGDLDSISEETRLHYDDSMLYKISDQNTTDCEKALQYCHKKNFKEIVILGALGKRMDHSLYNLGILKPLINRGVSITLYSNQEKIFIVRSQYTFSEPPGTQVSFLPVFGTVKGVRTENFQYPISGKNMELGFFSSISNRIEKASASIKIEDGYLLVIIQK